jgi:hypothetical protein
VQLALTKLFLATSLRNRKWYGSATPADHDAAVATILELGGSPSVDFLFTRSATRTLEIQLPRLALDPFDMQPGTGNSPLTETLTLNALEPAGATVPITVKVKNDLATYAAA